MLFLPFLDRGWQLPVVALTRRRLFLWAIPTTATAWVLFEYPSFLNFAVSTLMLAAIPEEWFFRAYLMTQLRGRAPANLITSLFFSLIHGLARDWMTAALVFAPSLAYGWLFQRSRDLALLVMIHALSNLIYAIFLAKFVTAILGNLR